MSKPEKFTAWPAECCECHSYGSLVICMDCGQNIHLDCAEWHRCRCLYCGKPKCLGECEEKPGFYDGDKWRRE